VLGPELRQIIVDAFAFAVKHERIYLRGYVVMPDHWHALLGLREPWTLPKFMHAFMSHLKEHKTGWQDGYYETLIKTARQFTYVAIYVEENPVKKGLVTTPAEWEESSASRKDLIADPGLASGGHDDDEIGGAAAGDKFFHPVDPPLPAFFGPFGLDPAGIAACVWLGQSPGADPFTAR
jgi:putative transposase